MNSLDNDFRIGIIRKDGKVDIIFSADDESCKNSILLESYEDIEKAESFYNEIASSTYKKGKGGDKHLFYLKQYLEKNFIEEFQNMNVNPQSISDDLLLYYYLSTINNIVFVNSSEHINILISPSAGISKEQENRLNDIQKVFINDLDRWASTNDMHIETFKENGQVFGTLELGQIVEGDFKTVISSLKNTNRKTK